MHSFFIHNLYSVPTFWNRVCTCTQAMNCCNWEWLKYSTVLLFPHNFTCVDHQEENSIILTLRDKIPRDSATLEVVWYLLLSWNDAVWLEGITRVVAWRHSGDALLVVCSVLSDARSSSLSSFRVASDFQGFLQRFD